MLIGVIQGGFSTLGANLSEKTAAEFALRSIDPEF